MLNQMMNFVRDEEGASAVEYGLIIGLIAVALITVLVSLKGGLSTLFNTAATTVTNSATPSS